MAGKFKTTTTSHRITDIMHSQSKYIPGVTDEYNAPRHVQMPPCVISLRSPAQNSRVRMMAIAAKKMDRSRRARKARQERY